ncbi:MAG: type I restriction endonuclease [Oscillospiraceae bacterium]|nr:type I restriction endonuclease [Oscillospiraceae bacterium]
MAKLNEAERVTQNHVVTLFQDKNILDYEYYGNLSSQHNANIMPDVLTTWLLSRGYSRDLTDKAIFELIATANNLSQGLYRANKNVYDLLKYGVKIQENPGESEKTVYFIDWEHSQNNDFAFAEEVTIKIGSERRPDLVIYINGIAIAVIELKKSTVSVSQGIRQNLSNQSEHFNKPFFTTIQFVMAGNTSEGLRYGVIDTKEKYFMEWKNDKVDTTAQPLDNLTLNILEKCKELPDKLDWQLYSMFQKQRFLDLIHNFIVFDLGTKKVSRHHQYFGVKKAQTKIHVSIY